jgi:hypothetical protein
MANSMRTTGANEGYFLLCSDHHWSDDVQDSTVCWLEEAAFPDEDDDSKGSAKKEHSSVRTTVPLGANRS